MRRPGEVLFSFGALLLAIPVLAFCIGFVVGRLTA